MPSPADCINCCTTALLCQYEHRPAHIAIIVIVSIFPLKMEKGGTDTLYFCNPLGGWEWVNSIDLNLFSVSLDALQHLT